MLQDWRDTGRLDIPRHFAYRHEEERYDHWISFSIYLILPAAGFGLDSASNRNEYEELPGDKR
jgi:hypothetical protein